MREAARRLEFERAAEIRDQIEALRAFFSTDQQAFDPEMGDLDFLGMARSGALAVVQLYQVRSGRILGRISRAVMAAMRDAAVKEKVLGLAMVPTGSTPEELGRVQKQDIADWTPAVKASGFRPT